MLLLGLGRVSGDVTAMQSVVVLAKGQALEEPLLVAASGRDGVLGSLGRLWPTCREQVKPCP